MAASLTYYSTNKLIDHLNGKVSFTMPAAVWMSLSTTAPAVTSTSGFGTNVTEPSATGSFARVQIAGLSFTATTGGTSATLTTASTTGLVVGMSLVGAGISAGTNITIASIVPNTSVTVSSSITWTASVYTASFWNYSVSGQAANGGVINFPVSSAAWSTGATALGYTTYYDSATLGAGNLIGFGTISNPSAVNASGVTVSIPIGNETFALS